MEMECLFCFSRLLLGTTELKSLLLALQNGLEGIKLAGYDLSFHSWPGNHYGCERLKNEMIGHSERGTEDRQDAMRTGICPPAQTLIIHSGLNL